LERGRHSVVRPLPAVAVDVAFFVGGGFAVGDRR